MVRVILFDRFGNPLGELSEDEVFGLVRTEKVNGEHSLTITTTRVLEKGWRVLTCDARGIWREHVVYGTDALHDSAERPFGGYYCVWSVQPDLMGTRVSAMPGVINPTTAALALDAALGGTGRWSRGTVTQTTTGGASMYDTDGWSAMGTLIETWGGEVDTTIGVGSAGVVSRQVDLYDKQGDQSGRRRFDFGADIKSVRRRIEDGPLYCRITPRGRGEETEGGGYGRKITIESVNDGKDYLENPAMVDLAKLPDGHGGWEYPTLEIENPDIETPAELKAWAQALLEESTVPKVTYEVDVMQLAREGADMHGVSLGDAVQVVDRKFGGLRIAARVMEMTVNMLDEADAQLTIGQVADDLSTMFGGFGTRLNTVANAVYNMNGGTYSTAGFLSRLLERLNEEINADGGYAYITEGHGILCYDTAVSDPLVGAEASKVVEIKGGSIRIANTKTAQGAWEWKSVFTSGHIAAEVVTAAAITTGYIGNASSGTYIDLDSNTVQLGSKSSINATVDNYGFDVNRLTDSVMHLGYEGTSYKLRIGKSGTTQSKIVLDSAGSIDLDNGSSTGAHIGYDSSLGKSYVTIGTRKSGSTIGSYSTAYGSNGTASGERSFTSGQRTTASGLNSCAFNDYTTASGSDSAAFGTSTTASGTSSFASGSGTTASNYYTAAFGLGTIANQWTQFVCGRYNSPNSGDYFEVGNGNDANSRSNAFRVTSSGTAYVGSTQVTSDRRVKTPLGDIAEAEAADFVRSLKPSKFEKFGRRELGFYAQDVEETNLGEYLVDESDDHGYEDFKNLSYDGIIAPLVAYCQHLEKRIEELERGGR